jgi:nucleotide-binding universal stress UspA family protein
VTFKRLVVGTDGSDSAMRAVDHAAQLAAKVGGELIVMHALPKRKRPPGQRERVTASYEIGASILRDAAAWYRDRVEVRSVLREGPAADALVAAAREEDADLLVVGNRGLGTRKLLTGNVPARVAQQAPCTVLVVHTTDSVEGEPYSKVLLATDGSRGGNAAALVGGQLGALVGAEVRLLHVGDPNRGRVVLDVVARSLAVPALGRTVGGDPADRIVEAAREEGCDLVVIGQSPVRPRRLRPGVPTRVARHAPAHVLLVKPA